jgi:hypothetical protein
MSRDVESVFEFVAPCRKCEVPSRGRLHFTLTMQLVDTDGGMLFNEGWTCHDCLGQPWSSADFVLGEEPL